MNTWQIPDTRHHNVYDVNTIANYGPTIIPFLDSPIGSVFERRPNQEQFVAVSDWKIPD
jgi:hypothetical protein